MKLLFYQSNSQFITLTGVTNTLTGATVTDATITGTLYDPLGATVPGATSIAFSYNASAPQPGTYNGQIGSSFNPPVGSGYKFVITGTEAALGALVTIPAKVLVRSS